MMKYLRRPNIVLLACQPKSASTFIVNALAALPGCRSVRLVPGYDRREQELSEARIRRYRFRGTGNLIAQAHVRRSVPTDRLIDRYGIRVVVLTRNPYDTVVSLRDHIRNESERIPFAFFTEAHRQMADGDLDMAIVRFVLPWVLSFRQSWKDHPAARYVDYDDFVRDETGTLARIAADAGLPHGPDEIARACRAAAGQESRRNVGRPGRGEQLSAPVKEAIAELARVYAAGDPGPDLADFLRRT